MSRKGRDAACTYCGVELTKSNQSSDHVLPKCLFSTSQRDGLVMVDTAAVAAGEVRAARDLIPLHGSA